MPAVGFETTVLVGERPQTYALDRVATETGTILASVGITPYIRNFCFRIYLTEIGLSPDGSSTVHIYAQMLHKGKAIPLQAWTSPEGSRRLRLPDFMAMDTWRW